MDNDKSLFMLFCFLYPRPKGRLCIRLVLETGIQKRRGADFMVISIRGSGLAHMWNQSNPRYTAWAL